MRGIIKMKKTMAEVLKDIQHKYKTEPLRYDPQSYAFVANMCRHFDLVGWITEDSVASLVSISERIRNTASPVIHDADPMRDLYKTGY